jgi:hypothetical protein
MASYKILIINNLMKQYQSSPQPVAGSIPLGRAAEWNYSIHSVPYFSLIRGTNLGLSRLQYPVRTSLAFAYP